jgi:hypothetical protein
MIPRFYNKAVAFAMMEMGPVREMGRYHVKFDRGLLILGASVALALLAMLVLVLVLGPATAEAAPKFVSCGGAAMLGGAQLNCTHLAPTKPAQLCNFSWSLLLPNNVPQMVSGSFLLPQGSNNATVYQGSGFVGSLTAPIVLCQDQH